jgi:hypothetical protein
MSAAKTKKLLEIFLKRKRILNTKVLRRAQRELCVFVSEECPGD